MDSPLPSVVISPDSDTAQRPNEPDGESLSAAKASPANGSASAAAQADPAEANGSPDSAEDDAADADSADDDGPEIDTEAVTADSDEHGAPTSLALPPEPSASMRTRATFLVPPAALSVQLDANSLPEQPLPECSLLSLLPKVARRALELGLGSSEPSFHVFVAADVDVPIQDELMARAAELVRGRPGPSDLVYVYDFEQPELPHPLRMPPGTGPAFEEAMADLMDGLHDRMPQLAEAEEVSQVQARLHSQLEASTREIVQSLESTARTHGFGVRTVQGAFQTFPILHGKPLTAEQFDVLDEGTKRALQSAAERLTREVEKAARRVRAHNARIEMEQDDALGKAAGQLVQREMRELFERFASLSPEVARYLRRVRQALSDGWRDLFDLPQSQERGGDNRAEEEAELAERLDRFRVNVLVSHRPHQPPPVVFESDPSAANLFGYLARQAKKGALVTDFMRIRPGALHRAMNGVLVLRATDLLGDPMVWERLKRALRERRLAVEDPVGIFGFFAPTLRPQPVPLEVRVVLIGPPELYDQLRAADDDFATLFRVKVEIDPFIERSPENIAGLDAYLMALGRERGWAAFDRDARAHLVDLSTRLAEDRERMALFMTALEETAAFASVAARLRDPSTGATITALDIDEAWNERRARLSTEERHIREACLRGEVAVDTTGMRVGVVNGLSVLHTGDVEFGQPMRITAVVALGREGIVDVEREAQLGGAIHTKGVAIVRGYLGWMFGQERPLSLRAQLVFEQSYGEIDGDSASSSELFAVLSALADVGIDQGIAVTGSVNQLGEMQAIGGVCAKVEGFYDLCLARGLTGTQGVMLPRANLPHLVLRPDVTEAVAGGRFHIYAIDNVAQGIEVLCGLPAGVRDSAGRFPAASVFGRVERRIIEIAERLRQAESHGFGEADPLEEPSGDLGEHSDFRILSPR
jgi:predicted ATP-dependent protease